MTGKIFACHFDERSEEKSHNRNINKGIIRYETTINNFGYSRIMVFITGIHFAQIRNFNLTKRIRLSGDRRKKNIGKKPN